ncbi:MAG: MarR family transcriptional regulator [Eubacteriaceae bacterium]|nr:MarR family transcriptional regulator [Eubacteriaceae bacterium]
MEKIYAEIGRMIMSYDKYFKVFMKKELAPADLNVAESMILLSLYENDGLTQEELTSALHYDKSVMTRAIQSLEKKDRIDRVQVPDDGRAWILRLTAEGHEVKPKILNSLRAWCRKAFDGIDDDGGMELLGMMRTIVGNIETPRRF